MEREARALREEDAWVRDTHSTYPNPPRVVHADASRGVRREPARCRVPRYPPPLPRSLEVVPTIFVLEAKARRETEEEVIREKEERKAVTGKTIKNEEEERSARRRRELLAAAWAKVKSVAASSRARAAALATERARAEAERARAEAAAAAAAARAARRRLEQFRTRLEGSDER
tara:strand:+ start:370 stop:891 length:522 start_codon:yes stop_codon:yes gene_type:complete